MIVKRLNVFLINDRKEVECFFNYLKKTFKKDTIQVQNFEGEKYNLQKFMERLATDH